MRRVAIVVTSALVALVSCFIKPDRPSGSMDDGGTDGRRDGGLDGKLDAPDDALSNCGVHDDFDNANLEPCGTWGSAVNASGLSRGNSALEIAPPTAGVQSFCQTLSTFNFAAGASVEIARALVSGSGGHTFVDVTTPAGEKVELEIMSNGSPSGGTDLYLTCMTISNYVRAYDAIGDRWVRFSAGSNSDIVVETGSDGNKWNYLSTCPVGGAANAVWMRFGAELGSGGAASLPAQFDNFNIKTCPPPSP